MYDKDVKATSVDYEIRLPCALMRKIDEEIGGKQKFYEWIDD